MKHNYRQGDVPLMPYTGSLEGFTEVQPDDQGKHVLALGEATGHHHRFENCSLDMGGNVRMYRDFQTGAHVVEVLAGGASLIHEEHEAIDVPAGRYLQLIQVEDDGEMVVQVAD